MHFFLHGGSASPDTEKNQHFFQTICKTGDTILIVPFSEGTEKAILFDQEAEQIFFEKRKNIVLRYNEDKKLSFECASRDTQTFIDQIKRNSVLFFCGGKSDKHLEAIQKIPDLKELLTDKVIVGNSAGSVIRTKAYYDTGTEKIKEGIGYLPIKMMIHRGSSRHPGLSHEERSQILENYGEKLPIYKIPEQEYIEFTL